MIYHIENSNITKVKAGIIVHGCNARGVMGSGVAKQLRATYPQIFEDYRAAILYHVDQGKSPMGYVACTHISPDLIVANAITQEFYGQDGKKYVSYDALDQAMYSIGLLARVDGKHIHVPYLIGAGLGGGNTEIITSIIKENTHNLVVNFHHWK